MPKHTWTLSEEQLCCKEVLLEYVKPSEHEPKPTNQFIDYLLAKLPSIERGSIRMKIQNIKSILEEYRIPNRLDISCLDNYSLLNLEAFNQMLLELAR
ncbi:hypothetical protein [Fibrobacter sp.]|uniref:hypothetical protein n=1 Tax=Fibrobacter sp. TaxID=35828 RepID=UPI00386D63EB